MEDKPNEEWRFQRSVLGARSGTAGAGLLKRRGAGAAAGASQTLASTSNPTIVGANGEKRSELASWEDPLLGHADIPAFASGPTDPAKRALIDQAREAVMDVLSGKRRRMETLEDAAPAEEASSNKPAEADAVGCTVLRLKRKARAAATSERPTNQAKSEELVATSVMGVVPEPVTASAVQVKEPLPRGRPLRVTRSLPPAVPFGPVHQMEAKVAEEAGTVAVVRPAARVLRLRLR